MEKKSFMNLQSKMKIVHSLYCSPCLKLKYISAWAESVLMIEKMKQHVYK